MSFLPSKKSIFSVLFICINFVLAAPQASANGNNDVISIEKAKENYRKNSDKRKSRWSVDTTSKTRYRYEEDKERMQQYFRLRFRYNVENSDWEIIGIVRTGSGFNSSYDTFYDFEAEEDALDYDPNFNLSHFYLKNSKLNDGKLSLELGSIPTDKGIQKVTALDSGGFIEGARVKVKTKLGVVTVAGGYLGGEDDPHIFDREDREFNYFEVRLRKEFLDKLGAEKIEVDLGAIHYGDRNYFSQVVKARYNAFSNRVLTLVQEGLFDDEGGHKVAIGVEFDLMNLITGVEPNKNGIKLGLRYQNMSDDAGDFASLGSGFYAIEGNTLIVEAKKRIPLGNDGRTNMEIGYRGRDSLDGDEEFRHEVFISISHTW